MVAPLVRQFCGKNEASRPGFEGPPGEGRFPGIKPFQAVWGRGSHAYE
jgi:hypothetical protein